jgi:hypothetical protein
MTFAVKNPVIYLVQQWRQMTYKSIFLKKRKVLLKAEPLTRGTVETVRAYEKNFGHFIMPCTAEAVKDDAKIILCRC